MKGNEIRLIDCIMVDPGLNLAQLVGQCNIPQTTIHRTLTNLCHEKLLLRRGERYFLGSVLLRWMNNSAVGRNERYAEVIHPYLLLLAQGTGETIHLVQRENFEAFYIDKVEGKGLASLKSKIGNKLPLYSTGAGRALLTLFTPEELREYWCSVERVATTPRTQTDERILEKEIANFRCQGYAVEVEQDQVSVQCLGAPIDLDRVQLAISITTTILCGPDEFLKFAELLQKTAQKITAEFQF